VQQIPPGLLRAGAVVALLGRRCGDWDATRRATAFPATGPQELWHGLTFGRVDAPMRRSAASERPFPLPVRNEVWSTSDSGQVTAMQRGDVLEVISPLS
jgi:hypothetical protein